MKLLLLGLSFERFRPGPSDDLARVDVDEVTIVVENDKLPSGGLSGLKPLNLPQNIAVIAVQVPVRLADFDAPAVDVLHVVVVRDLIVVGLAAARLADQSNGRAAKTLLFRFGMCAHRPLFELVVPRSGGRFDNVAVEKTVQDTSRLRLDLVEDSVDDASKGLSVLIRGPRIRQELLHFSLGDNSFRIQGSNSFQGNTCCHSISLPGLFVASKVLTRHGPASGCRWVV